MPTLDPVKGGADCGQRAADDPGHCNGLRDRDTHLVPGSLAVGETVIMSPSVWGGEGPCLLAALGGSEPAWAALVAHLGRAVLHVARRWGRGLPPDVQEEAAQEAWAAAARATAAEFAASGQTALAFVTARVPNAVQRVRSAYRVPGTRSRRRAAARGATQQVHRTGWDRAPRSNLADLAEIIAEPRWREQAAARDARVDVARAIEVATPAVRAAASLVLDNELSFNDAAAAVGLSASTFKRHLAALPARLSRAA